MTNPPHHHLRKRRWWLAGLVILVLIPQGGGGLSFFSAYLGSDPASTIHPKNRKFKHSKNVFEILATQKISPILYLDLKKRPLNA